MLKKLEHEALAADLVAVESLLASRTEEDDPTGFIQYSARKSRLEEKLRELDQRIDHHAALAVFFGGGPVHGARGINADFAGKALDEIQALITKCYSHMQSGGLRQRGRLPLMEQSKMLLTSVVRGSIGFVLEEPGDTAEILETPLRTVVDQVSDILVRAGAEDEAVFDAAAATLDQRLLSTLKKFFVMLDEQQATLRVVNGNLDILLDRQHVSLARHRVQHIEIDEHGDEYQGTIYLMPESRRFEMSTVVDGERAILVGGVGPEAAAQLGGQQDLDVVPIDARQVPRHMWRAEIQTRQIRERNRAPRKVYTLLRLIRQID